MNDAAAGATTDTLAGCVAITGADAHAAADTDNVATPDVAVPTVNGPGGVVPGSATVFVYTARYLVPVGVVGVVTTVSVFVWLPASVVSAVQVVPPSVESCHCTVGVGVPVAAAVKVAVPPAVTDWLAGEVVTAGGATMGTAASVFVGALHTAGSGPALRSPGVLRFSVLSR